MGVWVQRSFDGAELSEAACSGDASWGRMLRALVLTVLAAGGLVAAIAAAPAASRLLQADLVEAAAAAPSETAGEAWAVDWKGYVRAGPADMFAHTLETEGAVAPLARMGFNAEVPEGTTALEFALKWPAGTKMHVMAHGPHEAGMPTYMGEWPDSGEACIRVPAAEALPGTWKVMAHSEQDAVDLAFVVTVRSVGVAGPEILEGLHGHPMMDTMNMQMRGPEPCEG